MLSRRYLETESEQVRQKLHQLFTKHVCRSCGGSRIGESARHVFVDGYNIVSLVQMSIDEVHHTLSRLNLPDAAKTIAEPILQEILSRLRFLQNVGLNYLSLHRNANTLSGGESQRIRLASQIGSGLTGVMYILDEPSIGLHQRDNERLLQTLHRLRDLGNTLIVVET